MIQKNMSGMNMLRCAVVAAFTLMGSLSAQMIVAEPPAHMEEPDVAINEGNIDEKAWVKQSKTNLEPTDLEDNYDVNRLLVDTELYIWNRIADLLDIVRCGIGGGIGIGAELSLTEYVNLGAAAIHYERGVDFPHCIPPLWLINYYDKAPVLNYHTTDPYYLTAAFGPWRAENQNPADYPSYLYPRDKWDIRAQVHAGVLSAYINVSGRQVGDFFAGFIGLDPMHDDDRVDEYAIRMPADQFGRGVCNILFGVLEVPFNVIRITDEEGDLPGLSKGLGLGLWRFVCREVVGVVELVTFPFGWTPIIEPEYVFQKKRGIHWQVNRPTFHKAYHR